MFGKKEEKKIAYKKYPKRGPILMIIGIGILVYVLSNEITGYRNEQALLSTVENLLTEENNKSVKTEMEEPSPTAEASSVYTAEAKNSKETEKLIGKMKIECIDLEVPIVEGADQTTLHSAVGHVSKTAMPGNGNCVIAGHRNYSFGRFFNRLDEVQLEDKITIETIDGEIYTYEVNDISVVEPDEVSILESGKDSQLTLITCTPIYIASHRLIVVAKQVLP